MIAWVSPSLDGQRDALEDLLGAVLGVDRDVQVLDLQGAHAGGDSVQGGGRCRRRRRRRGPRRGRSATGSVAGQAGGLAGAQVEARAVQPALDGAVLDLALGERDGGVASTGPGWRRPRRRARATATS